MNTESHLMIYISKTIEYIVHPHTYTKLFYISTMSLASTHESNDFGQYNIKSYSIIYLSMAYTYFNTKIKTILNINNVICINQ